MINVVCVKVGTKYGADYVNRLGSMVSRHLSLEHTFHCVTEDPRGVEANILEVEETQLPGWWQKLTVFKRKPWGLEDPILFFDLDVVVIDDLDPLARLDSDFAIIQDFSYDCYNSSVFRLTPGAHPEVWDDFTMDVMDRLPGDQNWITECIPDATLWPSDWIVSYKRAIRRRFWRNRQPPAGARVVAFHGTPKPHQVGDRFVREHWR
ncbi:MAG TPA: hypothetical protein VJ925_01490 [Longimicrobiales bacterium]|nr:hypothetical protein [Longimicrobiales bacterium]